MQTNAKFTRFSLKKQLGNLWIICLYHSLLLCVFITWNPNKTFQARVVKWLNIITNVHLFARCCLLRSCFSLQVCDLHDGVRIWWSHPVLALSAHLPPGLHRPVAHAFLHLPLLHGARRCSPAQYLWNQLSTRGVSNRQPGRCGPEADICKVFGDEDLCQELLLYIVHYKD